jgi:hypothetical protein
LRELLAEPLADELTRVDALRFGANPARTLRASSLASSRLRTSPVNTPASTSTIRRPSSGPGSIPTAARGSDRPCQRTRRRVRAARPWLIAAAPKSDMTSEAGANQETAATSGFP